MMFVLYEAVNPLPFHFKLRIISIKQIHAVWKLYALKMIIFIPFSLNDILLNDNIARSQAANERSCPPTPSYRQSH